MNKLTIILIVLFLLLSAIIILPELASAQAPPPPPSKPSQTPIDGGLGLLAVAGGAYAVKKLRDRKA